MLKKKPKENKKSTRQKPKLPEKPKQQQQRQQQQETTETKPAAQFRKGIQQQQQQQQQQQPQLFNNTDEAVCNDVADPEDAEYGIYENVENMMGGISGASAHAQEQVQEPYYGNVGVDYVNAPTGNAPAPMGNVQRILAAGKFGGKRDSKC